MHSIPIRKYARRLHLWLGLSLGLLLVVICLSGAALVFYVEIDAWLHPVLERKQATTDTTWDNTLATLNTAYPDKNGAWRIEVNDSNRPISARYYTPSETRNEGFAPLMVWVSHDGNTVLRQGYWGHYLVTWLYDLHYTLLFGETGTVLIGYMGLAALIMLLSGLVAWWPKQGQWGKSIKFKARNSAVGRLYDWHKVLGLISFIPLSVLIITGVMLALPKETNFMLSQLLEPVQSAKKLVLEHPNSTDKNISIEQALLAARSAVTFHLSTYQGFNNQQTKLGLAWIQTPDNTGLSSRYFTFRFQTPSDPSTRFPNTFVKVDAQSAAVIDIFSTWDYGTANIIKGWLHALHDGSAGGIVLRVFWLLIGSAVLLLFLLGFMRWRIRTNRKLNPTQSKLTNS
ncbi:hypothetical protein FX988_02689 [Paraglaciecola mesophila]|uniref:PepSY domain-containing protein n=1 Tax=Paraglaciecola mesophila TaxID=197222 RepID=A0A857JM67_9ALTE|nr:hypothetical protein FX988_02689 [Paraglaciecola mesophila]